MSLQEKEQFPDEGYIYSSPDVVFSVYGLPSSHLEIMFQCSRGSWEL